MEYFAYAFSTSSFSKTKQSPPQEGFLPDVAGLKPSSVRAERAEQEVFGYDQGEDVVRGALCSHRYTVALGDAANDQRVFVEDAEGELRLHRQVSALCLQLDG